MTIIDPNPSHLGSSHALFRFTREVIRRERILVETYLPCVREVLFNNQVHDMQAIASNGNDSLCASLQRPAHISRHQQDSRRTASCKTSVKQRQRGHICAALTLDAPRQQQGLEQLAPQLHALGEACSVITVKIISFLFVMKYSPRVLNFRRKKFTRFEH